MQFYGIAGALNPSPESAENLRNQTNVAIRHNNRYNNANEQVVERPEMAWCCGRLHRNRILLGSAQRFTAGPAVVLTFVLSALISWTECWRWVRCLPSPAAGSFGVYAELYLNQWAGFIARYGYWFSVVIVIGSEVAAATYMHEWFPDVSHVWMVTFDSSRGDQSLPVGHYGTFEYWFVY
jgi:hypothetical protein